MSSQLVATFAYEDEVERIVTNIKTSCMLINNKIFVLETDEDELIITYNVVVDRNKSFLPNTILVHRKKETNTLYTINALNQLIIQLNDGMLDKNYVISWEKYRNTVLLYEKKSLKCLKTKVRNIYE